MRTSLTFGGGKQLAAALGELPARVSKRLLLASLAEASEPLRLEMEQRAPRESGQLSEAMVVRPARTRDQRETAVAVGASRRGYYGSFQEFGTAHVTPQPWARPAFEATWRTCLKILSDALWTRIAAKRDRGEAGGFSSVSSASTLEGEV